MKRRSFLTALLLPFAARRSRAVEEIQPGELRYVGRSAEPLVLGADGTERGSVVLRLSCGTYEYFATRSSVTEQQVRDLVQALPCTIKRAKRILGA